MIRTGCGSGARDPINCRQSKSIDWRWNLFLARRACCVVYYRLQLIDFPDVRTALTSQNLITRCFRFRDWKFEHPESGQSTGSSPAPSVKMQQSYSMRLARVGERSLFSKEVLYSLVLTNVLSILLGAGIGWVHRIISATRVSRNSDLNFPFCLLLFLGSGCRNAAFCLLACRSSKQSSPSSLHPKTCKRKTEILTILISRFPLSFDDLSSCESSANNFLKTISTEGAKRSVARHKNHFIF